MEIETLGDLDNDFRVLSYYTEGHVDLDAFCEAVSEWCDEPPKRHAARHAWMRYLPRVSDDGGRMFEAQILEHAARGAKPITIYDV